MTRYQQATRIWPALVLLAQRRSLTTYKELCSAVGAVPQALGSWLGPIAYYCAAKGLPPLTVLVVQEDSGQPGDGYPGTRETLDHDRAAVFAYNWVPWGVGRFAPTAQELEDAEAERRWGRAS